jgi:hypothetical protein
VDEKCINDRTISDEKNGEEKQAPKERNKVTLNDMLISVVWSIIISTVFAAEDEECIRFCLKPIRYVSRVLYCSAVIAQLLTMLPFLVLLIIRLLKENMGIQ